MRCEVSLCYVLLALMTRRSMHYANCQNRNGNECLMWEYHFEIVEAILYSTHVPYELNYLIDGDNKASGKRGLT